MIFWEKRRDQKHVASFDTRNPSGLMRREKTDIPAERLAGFSSNVAADGYGTCILFHIPRNWVERLLSTCHRAAMSYRRAFAALLFVLGSRPLSPDHKRTLILGMGSV
ncbi:hypothetical protein SNK05_010182 [Fusarium graminearum]